MGMTYVLDTHALVWAWTEPDRLGDRARHVIEDPSTRLLVSAASAWELATKVRLGRFPEAESLIEGFNPLVDELGATHLAISAAHALRAGGLTWDHRDPFDRMLAAQASDEPSPGWHNQPMPTIPKHGSEGRLTAEEWAGRIALVARYLVDAGKVAPSLTVDGSGVRSTWLPLPGAGDRHLLTGLLAGDEPEHHATTAAALAAEVDRLVRSRLGGVELVGRRGGRRSVPQAWLESLTRLDSALSISLQRDKVEAFASHLDGWVASGAVALGRGRLCLRVHEPDTHPDAPDAVTVGRAARNTAAVSPWWIEVLVQDAEEPSLMVPVGDLWAGAAPFPAGSVEEILRTLGRMAAVAPELAPMLDRAVPVGTALDTETFLSFVDDRLEPLDEVGITLLLPSWWKRRRRVNLRVRAKAGAAPKGGIEAGLDFDALVSFRWEAALGDQRLTTADLRRLQAAADAKQSLVQVRGEWVHVDPAELQAVIARAGMTGNATTGDLLRASVGLVDLADAVPGPGLDSGPTDVVAAGWLGRLLDDVRSSRVAPCPTPEAFVGELRPYQQRGVGWLRFLGRLGLGACLADDMGLGKTAQLIATLQVDPVPGPTLVVCPVSVLGNWARELERFAPDLTVMVHHGAGRHGDESFAHRAVDHDVVLSTYSLAARDLDHLTAVAWGRVVLDEAQQVKNPSTATAKAVRALPAARRIALTGTPVENRLAELWSIMQFLNPGMLGSLTSFGTTFGRPIERESDAEATAALQRRVGPFLLRRLKTDRTIIDDLPDKIEQTERCPLSREQATLYRAVVDDLLASAAREEGIARSGAVLAGIAKLKQVCNHPAHFLGDGSELSGRSGKLDRVDELLDEIIDAGDKVLCFTQFAEWGALLVGHLAQRYGVEPLWLHGGVSRPRREEMMARFADVDGPPVFLLSLKAGGTGLNLTAASHVIHLDRWWNPAVEDQATDRAYRIGQRRTVLVHKLVSTGTIEERIDEMITAKRQLAQRVVGNGEQWITKLSTDELRDIISLRDLDVA